MASLRKTQLIFKEALLTSGKVDLIGTILEDGISVEDRIDIYRNNILGSWTDALRAAYPVVDRLVGDEFFDYSAKEFFKIYPSRSGDLHQLGAQFSEFLKTFPPTAELQYLPDVAKLEWACHCVFFAKDHESLNRERLAEVSPDYYLNLKFKLHPATELIISDYPIGQIWEVNQEGYDGDQSVDIDSGGVAIIVRRQGFITYPQVLPEAEFHFLKSLGVGQTIAISWEISQKYSNMFELAKKIQDFVAQSILVDFYF